MAKALVDVAKVDALVAFVRDYNDTNEGRGCPRGVMQYNGGFDPAVIRFAHETGVLESGRGKEGGSWPAGAKPLPKTDDAPSVTARAFDMILALSRGEAVSRDAARQLWDEREALNASRRKN